MNKTICKNWEVNYECKHCGVSIMNAVKHYEKCTECSGELKVINPLNSRKEIK